MREFVVTDEGDEFQLELLQDGIQVGGAVFPDDGTGAAFDMARGVGASWAASGRSLEWGQGNMQSGFGVSPYRH